MMGLDMKNNKNNKILAFFAVASLMFSNTLSFANAQEAATVGDIAKAIVVPLSRVDILFAAFCYTAGLALGVYGCFKLKEYSDSKGQSKFSTAILYLVGSALLLTITTYMQMGREIMGVADGAYNPDSETFKY